MNHKFAALLLMALTAAGTLAATRPAVAQTDFGKSQPSVKDIVDSLKEDDATNGVRTRSLRPGAAAEATSAAVEPMAAPSISMQIQFDYASDSISGASKKIMNNLAAALTSAELQSQTFTIVGHTDGRGAAEYNMALSQRRAASVKAYLVSNGVGAERLKTVGKGLTELANKDNPAAAENRRVEIIAGS